MLERIGIGAVMALAFQIRLIALQISSIASISVNDLLARWSFQDATLCFAIRQRIDCQDKSMSGWRTMARQSSVWRGVPGSEFTKPTVCVRIPY